MTFPVLLFAYVLSQFFRAFLAVIAGDLTRDLGLDAAALGSLPAAWLFAFALAQFPIGYSLDRIGPRRTLAGFMTSAVAGAALLGFSRDYPTCLCAMALIGIGCAPVLMAGFYLAARLYSIERFATISSLLIGIGSIGDPLSGAPLALAVGRLGWRETMLVMAAVTGVCVVAVWFGLRDPPPLSAERPRPSFVAGFAEILSIRGLWTLLPLTFTSYAVTIAIRGLWIVPYLVDVQGFGGPDASVVAMAMGVAMALGALAYAPLSRWLGSLKRTVLCGVAACALACLALAAFGRADPPLAVALLLAIGFSGTSYAIVMAHGRSFMPADAIGRGVTFMNFVFMGGAGVLQWLSGHGVQAALAGSLTPAATYGYLFAVFGGALAAALSVYAFSPVAPLRPPAPLTG